MSINLFTTHKVTIENNQVELFPFGDVHYDTRSCDIERFRQYVKMSKKLDQKNCLYLLMGDALDFSSTSELQKIQSAKLHETTIDRFDRMAKSDINKFCKEIDHMKGNVIGIIGGNHQWKFADGKLSDEVIAENMRTKYLGWLSYIRIVLILRGTNTTSSFDIVACHGKAGGKLLGTSINQVDDLRRIFPSADLYIMGHDHRLSSTPAVSLYAYNNTKTNMLEIKQREHRLVRSGSFKKTYSVGEESYEISRLYQPSILGAPHITLKANRHRKMVNGKHPEDIIKSITCHV